MSPAAKGPVSQRELARTLIVLIDAARVSNSTAHKDVARAKLRELLEYPGVNWSTPFILHNLGARRCRYLNSIGHWVPGKWSAGGWTGPRAEAPEAEE